MAGRTISRVLAAVAVALPVVIASGVSPAAAITCSPGDTVNVKVLASPTTVPAITDVAVTFKAFNCTAVSQSVHVVSKNPERAACGVGGSSDDALTFTSHQRIQRELTFAPLAACAGRWRFTLVVFQGTTRVSKSWADFTVVA